MHADFFTDVCRAPDVERDAANAVKLMPDCDGCMSFTRYGTREIRKSTRMSVVSGGLTAESVSTLQVYIQDHEWQC
jgi:hypothetical protein